LLSLNLGLSERLIQKVKLPTVCSITVVCTVCCYYTGRTWQMIVLYLISSYEIVQAKIWRNMHKQN